MGWGHGTLALLLTTHEEATFFTVIPGRDESREPGIHNHQSGGADSGSGPAAIRVAHLRNVE